MILSGNEIRKELGKTIVIDPFNEKQLNPNSYNLRLDKEILVYERNGNEPLDMRKDNPTKKIIIPETGLLIKPGELILGKTVEYTESHKYLPCLEGRSSIGRLGLCIHITAGFGDVGFCGNWTLEITATRPIIIYPNIEICQIYYQEVKGEVTPYNGKYNKSREVIASRLFKDFE